MLGERRVITGLEELLRRVESIEKRKISISNKLRELDTHMDMLQQEIEAYRRYENEMRCRLDNFIAGCEKNVAAQTKKIESAYEADKRRYEKQIAKLQKELLEVHANAAAPELQKTKADAAEHQLNLSRASTIAIFDSIVAAIGNWSTDGQTAPDFELLIQSILFPLVYEPVMNGDEDYFLASVPVSAHEVVKRGREYVKALRADQAAMLTSAEHLWIEARASIREWIINDALPLLYGVGTEQWGLIEPVTMTNMFKWRDEPASRALEFPLIWDGMELVSKMGDDIREHSGLPEFNRQQLLTRIEP